jgi:hypothetical protein
VSNTLLGYRVEVRFDVEENAPMLLTYEQSLNIQLPSALLIEPLFPPNTTSCLIRGCYHVIGLSSPTQQHCLSPWTVYQVVVTAVGSLYDGYARSFAVTLEERQRTSGIGGQYVADSTTDTVLIRATVPQPLSGQPLSFACHWIGQYNQSGSFMDPITTIPGSTVEAVGLSGLCQSSYIIRIFNVIPYSEVTAWFASVNSAGPSLSFVDPVVVRTLETYANIITNLTIQSHHNTTTIAVIAWDPPYPPYGIIVRYQLMTGLDPQRPASSGTIVYDSNDTTTLRAFIDLDDIPSDGNVRARAFTRVGAGQWSGTAVNVVPSASSSSWSSVARNVVLEIVLPILTLVIIMAALVMVYQRRRRSLEVFTFPPPDRWELRPSSLELRGSIGKGAFGKVCEAVLQIPRGEVSKLLLLRR